MKKLAIVVTHPIQYYTPVFKLLAQQTELMVFYTWGEASISKYDPGFGRTVEWDIDLLEGYNFRWQQNTSRQPGSHHYKGIINPGLINELIEWQPDAILIYGWAYQSHLKVMRYFKGKVPVYFRGDSTLLDEKPSLRNTFKYLFLKWVYKSVDHAFYNGFNNKAYFEKYGLTDAQLSFAPHAVDNDRFATERPTEVNALRKELGLNHDNTLIVFAGKFENKKDPLLLLEAFNMLNESDTHLLFVGNGALEQALRSASAGDSNVHFSDFQNQTYMPVVYQAADVFCLPSKGPGETWGLAVNEAMACGKPVIVSDKCGCAADIVHNNKNGYIFKSQNAGDLLTCLKLIITDKQKLTILGNTSKQMIAAWNFENMATAFMDKLYEKN